MGIDREKLRKAASAVDTDWNDGETLGMNTTRDDLKRVVDAILSEITAQGYVIVPREPSEGMLDAATSLIAFVEDDIEAAQGAWSAMIAAAQEKDDG